MTATDRERRADGSVGPRVGADDRLEPFGADRGPRLAVAGGLS